MDATSSRQWYTREDVMALLDTHGDLQMDDEDLDEIFYPGSDEERFVVEGSHGDNEASLN